jgi:hypothetical protein
MFAKIEKATEILSKGATRLRRRARRTREYLRDDLPIRCMGRVVGILGRMRKHAELAHEEMVTAYMCSDRCSVSDLEGIWDLDYPTPTWDAPPNVREVFGLSPETPPFSGAGVTTRLLPGEVVDSYTNVREEARRKGQEAAQALRESQENQRQENIETLAESLTEALEGSLEEGASMREVLLQVCKMNILAWQSVKDGNLHPRTPVKALLKRKPAPEPQIDIKIDE